MSTPAKPPDPAVQRNIVGRWIDRADTRFERGLRQGAAIAGGISLLMFSLALLVPFLASAWMVVVFVKAMFE